MTILLLLSLLAATDAEMPPGIIWATVTRTPSATTERLSLDFGTLGVVRHQPGQLVYFARWTATRHPDFREVRWADSQSCPALTGILSGLRDLPTPRIDVPGFPGLPGGIDEGLAFDGVDYRLNLSDRLSYSMNTNSALSRWTDDAVRRLEPCWRAEVPRPAF